MNQYKDLFLLDPLITFLNFGSFGACPQPVFEKYQALQVQLEREPVQFIVKDGMELLAKSRSALAEFVGCHSDDLVYVTNPSYAINTIAKSFRFNPGDEVLTTNLEYGAMDRTWNYYCEKAGAKYIRQAITLPIVSKEAFLADFWKGFTERTKVVFISQITSATGMILPVKEICSEAKRRGLLTIVDGAHVPAHIPLNLAELEADIYTGACHKWMMAPKGASFLYAVKEQQAWIDPLLISWGYQSDFPSHSQFLDYHQTAGTRDFSAFLCIPDCIDFMKKYNWDTVAETCRNMVLNNANRFLEAVEIEPICPLNAEFIGQMYSIPVRTKDPLALYQKLFLDYRIEIPVTRQDDRTFIRYSIQAFNDQDDLNKLMDALIELKKSGVLLM